MWRSGSLLSWVLFWAVPTASGWTANALAQPVVDPHTICRHDCDPNLDGYCSSGDAQRCFFFAIGTQQPTYREFCSCDANQDGIVSAGEAQDVFLCAIGELGACDGSCGPDAYDAGAADDEPAAARPLELGVAELHSLCPAGDRDFYTFELAAPALVEVLLDPAPPEGYPGQPSAAPFFEVLDADLRTVARSGDAARLMLDSGPYYVRVATDDPASDATVPAYVLRIRFPEAACDDGLDNDGDGATDCDDSDCVGTTACPGICTPAAALDCGGPVAGSTVDASSVLTQYGCAGLVASGPEVAYSFQVPETRLVTVRLTEAFSGAVLIVLASRCENTACSAWGQRKVSFVAEADIPYSVVVDGEAGASGAFELFVECAPPAPDAAPLQIHHIRVGQGDATLVRGANGVTVLVDAGGGSLLDAENAPRSPLEGISQTLDAAGICPSNPLDYILVSHYDTDHIGFLDAVIERYGCPARAILDRGGDLKRNTGSGPVCELTEPLEDYLAAAESCGVRATPDLWDFTMTPEWNLANGRGIDLGDGARLLFVARGLPDTAETCGPTHQNQTEVAADGPDGLMRVDLPDRDENGESIVALLQHGDFQELLGGDLTAEVEASLAQAFDGLSIDAVDVYKVHHHGSRYSSAADFLSVIEPRVAVCSAGHHGTYEHPHAEAYERLHAVGAYIYQPSYGYDRELPHAGWGEVLDADVVVAVDGFHYFVTNAAGGWDAYSVAP